MFAQENFEKTEEEKVQKNHLEEIRLIRTQWIPDIESMIPDVPDKAQKKNFETELSQIKTDIAVLENADFEEEETLKQAKVLYRRSEDLFGRVSPCFGKEKDAA